MDGLLWLIANLFQAHQKVSERTARIASLETALLTASSDEEKEAITKRINEIRAETMHLDAGRKAVLRANGNPEK
ncbi:MAG: hypothetical protein HYV32_03510 [Candidatus Kerfeldbacteria bacterium]|nr:hypothetical protein [Candidatus Kerfeldbacteria bacterium]